MKKHNDGKYFQTTKRGEIQELKEELHLNDKAKQKDAVKKVIAAMTVGKDVSALFPDVVNCIQTDNIELKKLVYLYVMNYAKAQPELAILAINTFRKDASDPNPLVRALAVRTMGCIRLDQVTEYLLEPLRQCCRDADPFVRKTAAICIPKVYEINPELVEEGGFVEILKDMISDQNPMVVANAVAGLSEISETSSRDLLELDKKETIGKLLTALNECTEWGQVFILDALSTYVARDGGDAESITERITARLSHANPAVVLASIKVVLKMLEYIENQEVARNLCKKLNPPLVTLLSNEPEIQFVALRNIKLIVQKRPGILATDVKMFFCKYNDPVYVKMEKVDIMVMLVSDRNVEQVLLELKEYATGVDVDFVRRSVRSIGRVAVKLERASERTIDVLHELIETKVNYVVQEAIIVIKDIFRKYPSRYEKVLCTLCDCLDVLDEPEAKASMIWIMGEYAERIENAEQNLDDFLTNFTDEPPEVQIQLLTAIVKLFLKRPASTQDMVSKVLKCATEDSHDHDLRDRGYVYWRLLSTNPEATKQVVLGDKPTIRDESQQLEKSTLDKLINDLSLMSSVYHKVPEEFVTRISMATSQEAVGEDEEEMDEEDRAARRKEVQEEMERGDDDDDDRDDRKRNGTSSSAPKSQPSGGGGDMDLLDMGGGGAPAPAQAAATKIQCLPNTTAGQGGKTGFGIASCLARENGAMQLRLTFSNSSSEVLSAFAIQVNKNPFGIAPGAALTVPDIAPGSSADVCLLMQPNQLLSGQPPSNPLYLQAAIKNSMDVFYFNAPFDLAAVLIEGAAVTRDKFTEVWQGVGEEKQHQIAGSSSQILTADDLKSRLALDNISYVAARTVDDTSFVYFSGTCTNNTVVLCEVATTRGKNTVKVVTRTETPVLVPLFEAAVCKRLGVTAQ